MILTGMTLEQAISLEPAFAVMQPNGQWKLPSWLEELERDIASRDLMQNQEYIQHLIDNTLRQEMHGDFSSREG